MKASKNCVMPIPPFSRRWFTLLLSPSSFAEVLEHVYAVDFIVPALYLLHETEAKKKYAVEGI
jgi:hypothetical protein